jgi:hypothetical protein
MGDCDDCKYDSSYCETCKSPKILSYDKTQCLNTCGNGYGPTVVNGIKMCKPCLVENCKFLFNPILILLGEDCSVDIKKCGKCENGYSYTSDGKCIQTCPNSGFVEFPFGGASVDVCITC